MPRKNRQLRIKVYGNRRQTIDSRHLARAIVRMVVEQGTSEAQDLIDTLEHHETLERRRITRQRSADRQATPDGDDNPGQP